MQESDSCQQRSCGWHRHVCAARHNTHGLEDQPLLPHFSLHSAPITSMSPSRALPWLPPFGARFCACASKGYLRERRATSHHKRSGGPYKSCVATGPSTEIRVERSGGPKRRHGGNQKHKGQLHINDFNLVAMNHLPRSSCGEGSLPCTDVQL